MSTRWSEQCLSQTPPDALPLLTAGRHATPLDGASFMEYASILAGEPFTDHPTCAHPLLAEVARRVDDRVDDLSRRRLVLLVPEVIGVQRVAPSVSAAIVVEVVVEALALHPSSHSRLLRHSCKKARRRGKATWPGSWWTRLSEHSYVNGAGLRAVACAIDVVAGAEPAALPELLAAAIAAARDAQGGCQRGDPQLAAAHLGARK